MCQILLGLFFGIAAITVIVRLILRTFSRHKLYFDDYLVIFGLLCLGAATGIIYAFSHIVFLLNAIRFDSRILPTNSEKAQFINSSKFMYSYVALVWTATYAVKFSFLVFFKQIIEKVSKRITIYYWTIVALCVLSWMFSLSSPFIACPYFGIESRAFPMLL
jgi:hypothetical protein